MTIALRAGGSSKKLVRQISRFENNIIWQLSKTGGAASSKSLKTGGEAVPPTLLVPLALTLIPRFATMPYLFQFKQIC